MPGNIVTFNMFIVFGSFVRRMVSDVIAEAIDKITYLLLTIFDHNKHLREREAE
jgi:hypothetical protein